MRRTIQKLIVSATLIAGFSFAGYAQQQEEQKSKSRKDTTLKSYSVGIRAVHFFDLPSYKFDTPLNRDMRGLNGDKTNFDIGFDIYAEKQFTPFFGAQLGFRYGQMTGANEVEYYENTFTQATLDLVFILSNLDAFHTDSRWNFYAKIGGGTGNFTAEQFLIEDDSPDDRVEDNFWEGHMGAGVQYEFDNSWRIELESMYNVAFNDGFDGFNNATGSDPYLTTAIGVAYTFGDKRKKPLYAVNYFGGEYMDLGSEPEPIVFPEPEVTKEDLEKVQEELEEQNAKIGSNTSKINQQQRQLDGIKEGLSKENSVSVYFNFDSSVLTREAKKQLASDLGDKEGKENAKLEIIAFADKTGNSDYNQKLKEKRAESVKIFLVELGYGEGNISLDTGEASELSTENQFLNRKALIKY